MCLPWYLLEMSRLQFQEFPRMLILILTRTLHDWNIRERCSGSEECFESLEACRMHSVMQILDMYLCIEFVSATSCQPTPNFSKKKSKKENYKKKIKNHILKHRPCSKIWLRSILSLRCEIGSVCDMILQWSLLIISPLLGVYSDTNLYDYKASAKKTAKGILCSIGKANWSLVWSNGSPICCLSIFEIFFFNREATKRTFSARSSFRTSLGRQLPGALDTQDILSKGQQGELGRLLIPLPHCDWIRDTMSSRYTPWLLVAHQPVTATVRSDTRSEDYPIRILFWSEEAKGRRQNETGHAPASSGM